MQPPRSRTSRFDFRNTRVLRSVILNATAGLVTILIVRLAVLAVSASGTPAVPGIIRTITDPIAWPFRQIPLLDSHIVGDALFADGFIILFALIIGLLASGIVTGWRESSTRGAYRSNPFD